MDKKVIPLKHFFATHMLLFARDSAKIVEFQFGLLRAVRAIACYGVNFAQKALTDLEVWVYFFFLFIWNLKIVLRVFKGLQRSFDDIRVAYSLVNTNKKNNCNLIPRFIPN